MCFDLFDFRIGRRYSAAVVTRVSDDQEFELSTGDGEVSKECDLQLNRQ